MPIATCFTYEVPKDLRSRIFVGCRVEVQFRRRTMSGIVVELAQQTDVTHLKPIRRIYDTFLPETLLRLTDWIASYYGCSFGEAAQSVLPPILRKSSRPAAMSGILSLTKTFDPQETLSMLKRAHKQRELAGSLHDSGGSATTQTVFHDWGFSLQHVKSLIKKGIVELVTRSEQSHLASMEAIVTHLNSDQEKAFDLIRRAIMARRFSPLLLQGVTGSGKTELYLRAAQLALSQGGGCIVLVPEIGLLPQAMARYRRALGEGVAILHSRLTGPERFEIWRRIEDGDCRAVLGPRSAIFSPVRNLRLIVVDEEQDDSYKQEDKPRYHARSVALMRGKFENLIVLLGSATPSAESLHHAQSGRYGHLTLPRRVKGARLPVIHFVDMRGAASGGTILSAELVERLDATIKAGHQSILFLNKRGHARFVLCNVCGWVAKCRNCDISLTYHRVVNRLKCHFCGYNESARRRCPTCDGRSLYLGGVGTQRIELDLASLFPGVGVLRMDADTTAGKEAHKRLLEQFGKGDYPILIGTQMVAKGHHFPNVNLVGVLFAEESLNYPDFRSSERTFQQLIQVAGRAGRASVAGEVIIQTYMPEHHVFRFLEAHDYDGFMKEELKIRRQLNYPPFTKLVLASCSASKQETLSRVVQDWAAVMRRQVRQQGVEVLGPVPPIVARVKNRYREQLLIKGRLKDDEKSKLRDSFNQVVRKHHGARSVEVRWDVDPESFQ